MVELFTELPQEIKNGIRMYVDSVLEDFQLLNAAKVISEFANSCNDEEEQDFVDFYFNLKLEEMQMNDRKEKVNSFENISEEIKNKIKIYVDSTLKNSSINDAKMIIDKFISSRTNIDEQNFVNFYFNLKLEEMQEGE